MAEKPKRHAEGVASHGRDLQKVNEQLKSLVASLRTEKERHQADGRHLTPPPVASPAESARESEVARLTAELALAREAVAHANDERERLRARLSEIEAENQRVCDDYVMVEERATELAQQFVALERLHGGLARGDTLTALQEIVINVVGSEELAILERRGDDLVPLQTFGVDASALRDLRVGQGAIGRAVATGKVYLAGREGSPAAGEEDVSAVVPLRAGDRLSGALVIFRLLGHKPGLDERDEAMLGLLSAHAGVALHLRGDR